MTRIPRRPTNNPNSLLACVLLATAITGRADPVAVPFNIPAQPLSSALTRFSITTGLQILYEGDIASQIQAPPLKGNYTPEAALQKLTQGSGVSFRFSNADTVTLVKAKTPKSPSHQQIHSQPLPPKTQVRGQAEATLLPTIKVVGKAEYEPDDPYNPDYKMPSTAAGTKIDSDIMTTPLNVQVVSKQVLRDQQVIRLEDALKNISGITFSQRTGASYFPNSNYFMGSTPVLRGFPSPIYFRNGFRMLNGSGGLTQIANVQSVDVAKGPGAVLFGMVEPGGVINVTTAKPQATPYYAFSQQFGSYDLYRSTVDATGPITKDDTLLYRMSASYENSQSFRDFVFQDDVFLAPVLKWNISPKTQITAELQYDHNHFANDNGVILYYRGKPYKAPKNTNYGELSPGTSDTIFGSFNWSHQFNDDWTLQHQFSTNHQDMAITSYSPTLTRSIHSDHIVIENGLNVANNHNETYATNLDLIGHFESFGLKHTLVTGGEYYQFQVQSDLALPHPGFASIVEPFNPVHHPFTPPSLDNAQHLTNEYLQSQYGLYMQDQIELPFKLHLMGGFRYQYLHQTSSNLTSDTGTALTQDAITPRVGLLWQPLSWLSVYSNYVESFGFNGFSTMWAAPNGETPVPATSAEQYEVGIKSEFFDKRLRISLAYYDLTKNQIVTTDPNRSHLCPSNGFPFYCSLAIAEANSHGPELDIQGEILPGWNMLLTFADTDVRITKSNDNQYSAVDRVGDPVRGIPFNTARLWSTYAFQSQPLKGITVGGGVSYYGKQLVDGYRSDIGTNRNFIYLPGYQTVDAMASYSFDLGDTTVSAQLNVYNLLDEDYYSALTVGAENLNFGLANAAIGRPRSFMGSVSIRY